MDVKKIAVAYDGSKGSKLALEWAVGMALKFNAIIMTVTVVKTPEFALTSGDADVFVKDAEKYYHPLLTEIREYGNKHRVAVKTDLLYGHPAECIVKYAFQENADLLITGTRGMGGFKNLVIGSVAQKVVCYSSIPVLVIKA